MKYKFQAILLLILTSFDAGAESIAALSGHPSPYLRNHADDPIHWRLNDPDINLEAEQSGKLIFLSSGYQSCYWCYRMKSDSFSNRSVASLLNRDFIAVIVDRELAPQLDAGMQKIMEHLRGFGGWPSNLVLTPEGYPVTAFSYVDPENLEKALGAVHERWKASPEELQAEGKANIERLNNLAEASETRLTDTNLGELLQHFLQQTSAAADTEFGGFGTGEKYPALPQLLALQRLTAILPDQALIAFLGTSLDAMLDNGLRDQLGGGLFRYTMDRQWQTPHYEQMLYTQALAAQLLIRSGEQLDDARYTDAGMDILQAMMRNFRREDDLFGSSLSAVGHDGVNGGHYLWKAEDLEALLGNGWREKIMDFVTTKEGGILPRLTRKATDKDRKRLLDHREREKPPSDDKALLGLNGLALSALALGARETSTREAGEKLAQLLNKAVGKEQPTRLIDTEDGGPALLEDLVYAARGLYDWWLSTGDPVSKTQSAKLLQLAYANYYQSPYWLEGTLAPLPGSSRSLLIQDSQLPSPAALWIDTAWRLAESAGNRVSERLADSASLVWPASLRENTFFHATWMAAMIERRVRSRSDAKQDWNQTRK